MSAAINQDVVAGLVATALSQARIASRGVRESVIPAWPPSRRTFPNSIARQLDRGDIFNEHVIEELEAFRALLDRRVADGTHSGWEADENHVRGGYEVTDRDEETARLARCVGDLRALTKGITDALDAIRAMRLAGELLDG